MCKYSKYNTNRICLILYTHRFKTKGTCRFFQRDQSGRASTTTDLCYFCATPNIFIFYSTPYSYIGCDRYSTQAPHSCKVKFEIFRPLLHFAGCKNTV